jgi:tetratricopeptide (TPR) repeat protein
MAKNTVTDKQPVFNELNNSFRFFPFKNLKAPYIVIILLGLIFNLTSLHNEYALDDGIIIHQNDHVIKGSYGIKDIITKDAYESFYRKMHATDQLAGGRYRPLSVVSFAMEQEIIGVYPTGNYTATEDKNMNGVIDRNIDPYKAEYNKWTDANGNNVVEQTECQNCWDLNENGKADLDSEDINDDGIINEVDCQVKDASIRHGVNIITFIIGIMMFYLFLSTCIFSDYKDLAFLSALLFLMHPLHTEVIANVKSRDEIFSLIFISLTFFYSFKYTDFQNYLKTPGFFHNTSAELKKIYFVIVVLVIGFMLYLMRMSGMVIMVPSLAIAALIIYRSYLTFFQNKKYTKPELLLWASFSFFLSLLSKEYAVTLLALVPVAMYIFYKNDFDIKPFLLALAALALVGLGGILFMKGGSPDMKSKALLVRAVGVVFAAGGIYVFMRYFKPYVNIFLVLFMFIVSAGLMLYIKYQGDIDTNPKPAYGYWIFPFIYLGLGIFVVGRTNKQNNFHTLMSWLYFVTLFYLAMRLVAVKLKPGVPDTEILNNPYLLASQAEQWATKLFVLLKYFMLCWFPHPLSSDYSFNTIEFRNWTSWDTLLSLVLHVGLAILGLWLFIKKHVIGFAILIYFAFLLMIGNILMDIGATMGERLLFHSTIGFVIAFAWLILKAFEKLPDSMSLNAKRVGFLSVLAIMTFLYGCKTWERNWDWKNDITLFLKDVETVPNSVLVLGNAGARYIDLSDTKNFVAKRTESLETGIKYLKHAVELHPRYVNGYLNLGLGSYKLGRDRDALYYWKHAEQLYPNNPYLKNYYIVMYNDLLNRGYQKAQRGQLDSAIYELRKTIILDKLNPEGFYNLGGAYYQKGKYDKAKYYWEQCLKLNPNHAQAKSGLATIVTVTVPTAPQPALR